MAKSLKNMMGAGIGAQSASLLNGTVADGLTAAGTTQADALALPGDVNVVTTVASGAGVRLSALPQPGDEVLIANLGANALIVYPPPGATIEGGPVNAPFTLPSGASAEFIARRGSSNWVALASGGTVAGTPVSIVAPKFVDGLGNTVTAPVVGQRLFIDVGTWTNSPSSFLWQVYDDAGAILDATGTASASSERFYIVYDGELARPLHIGVVASNGLSSIEALSTATSNVADRSFIKPTLTRTSSSGTLPMTFSIVLPATVLAGDTVHLQVASDNTFGAATFLQDVYHTLTEADLLIPFTPDWTAANPVGLTNPGATDYLRVYVETLTPQGRVISSPLSDSISPTDVVTAVTLNASDKTSGLTLSNGNLTGDTFTSGIQGARTNRGSSTQKFYFEMHADLVGSAMNVGAGDATVDLTQWAGIPDTKAASDASNGDGHWAANYQLGFTFATSNTLGVAVDPVNKLIWWALANVYQFGGNPAAGTGGISFAGASGMIYPIFQTFSGHHTATFNFGATAFTYTPPAGFTAIP